MDDGELANRFDKLEMMLHKVLELNKITFDEVDVKEGPLSADISYKEEDE